MLIYYIKLCQQITDFKLVNCFIIVYSLLGTHVTDYSIRMFYEVIVVLEYFDFHQQYCKSLLITLALCLAVPIMLKIMLA